MTGKPSAFSSHEWLTVPFAQNQKTAFDTAGNAFVSITYCSCLLHDAKIVKACGESRKETEFRMNIIREKALDVISQLDDWYARYQERSFTALLATPEPTPGSDGSPYFLSDAIYPDTLTASIVGL
jgi:hypothetical protein